MADTIIECPEVVGKTVRRLRLATADAAGQEIHIDFEDGTAFSFTVEATTTRTARLVSQSESGTDFLRTYGG